MFHKVIFSILVYNYIVVQVNHDPTVGIMRHPHILYNEITIYLYRYNYNPVSFGRVFNLLFTLHLLASFNLQPWMRVIAEVDKYRELYDRRSCLHKGQL